MQVTTYLKSKDYKDLIRITESKKINRYKFVRDAILEKMQQEEI